MGIDAEMFLKVKPPLPEEAVKKISFDMCEAFGNEMFVSWAPGNYPNGSPRDGRRPLEVIPEYNQDGPTITPEDGEQFIEVHMCTRYYGIGYERGSLPDILAVADWLTLKIERALVQQLVSSAQLPEPRPRTGSLVTTLNVTEAIERARNTGAMKLEVWYGGDSSGVEAVPLDAAHRSELWLHFVEHGHAPYRNYRGRFGTPAMPDRPACGWCGFGEMFESRPYTLANAYAPGKPEKDIPGLWWCPGCGLRLEGDPKAPTVRTERDPWEVPERLTHSMAVICERILHLCHGDDPQVKTKIARLVKEAMDADDRANAAAEKAARVNAGKQEGEAKA